eukprot:9685182-Alexandrium_andersonii.AAC.1
MVDLVRDLQARATAPNRVQRPRAQDEPTPVARAGCERLQANQDRDRLQLARAARAVRHRGR